MRRLLSLLPAALLLAACAKEAAATCGDGGSPTMCPGHDCTACHAFTAAGTVYAGVSSTAPVAGAAITIVPASGSDVVLTTNAAGNFYTSAPLDFPLQSVTVENGGGSAQMTDVARGGCNACHDGGFRIHLP